MVAKISSGKNVRGALNYNEQKVQEGKAECIQANLFKHEASRLTFKDKLRRFEELNERNQRTRTNTLHISLNFDPSEKLDIGRLNDIAAAYMEKIGFGNQPYLVYEHRDAAHPHVHIVTTLIQEDGKRIPIHNLGKNESEKARQEIEKDFGLVVASAKSKVESEFLRAIEIEKVQYGKSETRRSISTIVRRVTQEYKYTSLPELNAVLSLYNVRAERGTERSKMFARKGLLYCLIDGGGNRVGIPVKASAIYGKPTLSYLEGQYKLNEGLRQPHKKPLQESIDLVIQSGAKDTDQFRKALDHLGIAAAFRANAEGRVFGLTLIDKRRQVVFNGSDLGRTYSAGAILQRMENKEQSSAERPEKEAPVSQHDKPLAATPLKMLELPDVLQGILSAEQGDKSSPEATLRLSRKRKRRRSRGL